MAVSGSYVGLHRKEDRINYHSLWDKKKRHRPVSHLMVLRCTDQQRNSQQGFTDCHLIESISSGLAIRLKAVA